MKTNFDVALEQRIDLKKYKDNAHLIYALELYLNEEDVHSIAATSLTDGKNDKKLDLVYVSRDTGQAIIAQGYISQNPAKPSAKANKASDLNSGIAWLLSRPIQDIPDQIKGAAEDIREALKNNEINSIDIWYVHNLPESEHVADELKTVEHQARDILGKNYPKSDVSVVSAKEIGRNTLEEWYTSQETAILVNDEIDIYVPGGYEMSDKDWRAFVTSVNGSWLQDIYKKYPTSLFAANVRGFMGARKKDQKINYRIKESATNEAGDFWIYNNGITALVHEYNYDEKSKVLKIRGISIVNGAQTTGSLGTLSTQSDPELFVPARFISSNNGDKIKNITTFNNSQNSVVAADFRSNDKIQDRLRKEFSLTHDCVYFGFFVDSCNTYGSISSLPQ